LNPLSAARKHSSGIATRLPFVLIASLGVLLTTPRPLAAQGQEQQVTICHRTGSPTTPWVFMSIDASTLAEHEAQGDFRASSLADCAPPTPTPPPPPPTAQPVVQPTVALQTLPTLPPPPPPATPTPRLVPTAQPTIAAAPPTAVSPIEVAGAQPTAIGETPVPEVSTLPTSGDEPNRPALVLALLAVGGLGVSLRRLARSHG
jgi:hypothetical protein